MRFTDVLTKIWGRIRLIKDYYCLIRLYIHHRTPLQENSPTVFFNFRDVRMGTYYCVLMTYFEQAGYNLMLKNNFWFIANCNNANRVFMFKHNKLVIASKAPKNAHDITYVFDRIDNQYNSISWKNKIKIDTNAFPFLLGKVALPSHATIMPFGKHPAVVFANKGVQPERYRLSDRKMRITFSGSLYQDKYNTETLREYFNKLNRIETLALIKESLTTAELHVLKDYESDDTDIKEKFVLNDLSQSNAKKVPPQDWLSYLAGADFFLACPGVKMPMCYNTTEAMSVGTILITEYPEYFYPPLEHMKNCIAYNGKEDLIDKIKIALKMDVESIATLKENVITYYDNYLRSESFVKSLIVEDCCQFNLYLQATDISLEDYMNYYDKSSA